MSKLEKHPPGLFVLFFTEMWERFGFYSMAAMFVLYLRDRTQGFGWSAADAVKLSSTYVMFVYASPLVGGWLANWKLGYRNSVLIGGLVFMVGYFLFTIHAEAAMYAALVCLVIGNGFFKPNVSAMVGRLYPPGSHLRDRAYNIFYMGINTGAFLAPLVAEVVKSRFGFHVAFAVAFLVMYTAARSGGDAGRVSPWWLISAYGAITLGELMLSPMGLSLVSKVAPPRLRGVMIGGWFAANAAGNYLVGTIGVEWTVWSHVRFFATVALIAAAVAAFLFAILRPLSRTMPGV